MKFNGNKLRRIMKEGRWSQSELSRQSGVSQAVISGLCREVATNPTIKTINALAAALGIDPMELVEADEDAHAAA